MIGKLNHRNVTSISFYVQQQEQNRAGVVIKLSDVAWFLSNSGGAHDMLVQTRGLDLGGNPLLP